MVAAKRSCSNGFMSLRQTNPARERALLLHSRSESREIPIVWAFAHVGEALAIRGRVGREVGVVPVRA